LQQWAINETVVLALSNFYKTATQLMILSKAIAAKKLRRMAMQVAERNHNQQELVLIGIKENGWAIAEKLAVYLQEVFTGSLHLVALSLDKKRPSGIQLSDTIEINHKTVILIDDVANSGRTMLYALKPLLEQYPASIQTLALVERTHKLFPITMDYVGHSVSTTASETIVVEVIGGEVQGAYLQ
jgi:pyrimidine operon attenuation protein/uracil phosphoribosyltransferase